MAALGNGFEAVALSGVFVLRRWVNGIPQDLTPTYPFDSSRRGDRKRAFDELYRKVEQLNREAAEAANQPIEKQAS